MVKHVIIWNLKEEYSKEEKNIIKEEIKKGLEALDGKIPGMIDIKVYIDGLKSATGDLILDSTFENEEALIGYGMNPDHLRVANEKVRPFTAVRSCFDYEI